MRQMLASGRVLWIGIGLLGLGCAFLWCWIRRGGRKLRDSFALLVAGLVLTAGMMSIVWVFEGMHLSRDLKKYLELGFFVPLAMLVAWIFNKLNRNSSVQGP